MKPMPLPSLTQAFIVMYWWEMKVLFKPLKELGNSPSSSQFYPMESWKIIQMSWFSLTSTSTIAEGSRWILRLLQSLSPAQQESCKAQMPLLQALLRVDKTSFLNNVASAGTAEKAAESSVLWDHTMAAPCVPGHTGTAVAARPYLAPKEAAAHRSYSIFHKNRQERATNT